MKSQTFGEQIKYLRKKLNYSLQYVSDELNISVSSLSKIEDNKEKAPERMVKPLAKILETSYKELMVKYLSEVVYYQIRNSDYSEEALEIVQKRLKKEGKGTQESKDKDDIIDLIKIYFNSKPIEKAWLFGSFAKNTEVSYDSDIDILVEFKKPNKITLFDLIEMKDDLSKKTGREIDLVEKGQELKSFRSEIDKNKILVYAR